MRSSLLLAAAALAAGCAGVAASRRQPGTLTAGKFAPARPPAARYGEDPQRQCPGDATLTSLTADLPQGVTVDGRLCAVAEALLGWDGDAVPESVSAFVGSYFGLTAPPARVLVATIATEDAADLAGRLREPMEAFVKGATRPRFGLSTTHLAAKKTRLALVLEDAALEVAPLPRRLEAGGHATLETRGASADKAVVRDTQGRVEELPLAAGKAELRCGDKPGPLQVEIRGGTGALLARFAVACGEEPKTSIAVGAGSADPATQERALLEQINAARRAASIPELAWDDAAGKVARAVSEAARASVAQGGKGVAADPVQLLRQEGVVSPIVLENPAQARDVEDAHAQFEASATHRSNLLNPQVTHAGVGVVPAADGKAVFVTELFVRELPRLDAAKAREELRAAIARKRASPAAKDAQLDALAQRYAEALAQARGDLPKARADELAAPLYKGYRTVNLVSGAKADALDFAVEPSALGPGKLLGIGIAQGDHPALGRNAVYGVLILAAPR